MRMPEYEEMKECEQGVRLWLRVREIPYERYANLMPSDKIVLHNLVCKPTHLTSYTQREELYRKLCLSGGRETSHPSYFMTDEELREFFSPLTSSEKLHYLEKF